MTVGRAQVDVFAAGPRPQRRQLGIRRRAAEREHAARHPDAEEQPRVRNTRRDQRRGKENAAANDVGDDDRRGIKRTEAAIESGSSAGLAIAGDYSFDLAGNPKTELPLPNYLVSSCR